MAGYAADGQIQSALAGGRMDISPMAPRLGARLAHGIAAELVGVTPVLPGVEERMRVVNRLAERNHREGTGGPFAAVVTDASTGEVLSAGVNLVLATNLSSMH